MPKAASELKRVNSKFSDCMEAFELVKRAKVHPPASPELDEIVKKLVPSTCPVLGFGFSAAVLVKNREAAKAFVRELCHRYPNHPRLLHTVANAAIQARDPSIIQEAPGSPGQNTDSGDREICLTWMTGRCDRLQAFKRYCMCNSASGLFRRPSFG